MTLTDMKRQPTPPILALSEQIQPELWGMNIPFQIKRAFETLIEYHEFEAKRRERLNNKTILLQRQLEKMAIDNQFMIE